MAKRVNSVKCVASPSEMIEYKTSVSRNSNMHKLQAGYLFPEIARRRSAHLLKYPDAQIISLGIGDTNEPIPQVITSAIAKKAHELSTIEGYSGYGAQQGAKNPLSNMSDPIPEVGFHVTGRRLSPSEGCTNSVLVIIRTITTDDHRAITSTPINFSLRSCRQQHILSHLYNQLNSDDHWLCDYLASEISTAAIDYGFGYNGFELTMFVTVTYPYVPVVPVPSLSSNTEVSLKVLRLVLLGMKAEELKSLNMETESCSICLENLVSGSKRPTRMSCSHVFHDGCLLPWLYRKNTCPLCPTILYER